jgi:hypothetical protein
MAGDEEGERWRKNREKIVSVCVFVCSLCAVLCVCVCVCVCVCMCECVFVDEPHTLADEPHTLASVLRRRRFQKVRAKKREEGRGAVRGMLLLFTLAYAAHLLAYAEARNNLTL